MVCLYKKTFLKDLASLPNPYRKKIEKLVFGDIPTANQITDEMDIKKIQGYKDYYRIRIGTYRIGFRIEKENTIIFYRVKSRKDIYQKFPPE